MNRLPSPGDPIPFAASEPAAQTPTVLSRSVREPALLRLAQAIEELAPDLGKALCLNGLNSLDDPAEREPWRARLAPWLETTGDGRHSAFPLTAPS